MREMIRSRNNREDLIFGTTYAGSAIHPDHSVLIPCLHDESYAYLSCYREIFRRVEGVAFLTQTELNVARRLYEMKVDPPALVRGGRHRLQIEC